MSVAFKPLSSNCLPSPPALLELLVKGLLHLGLSALGDVALASPQALLLAGDTILVPGLGLEHCCSNTESFGCLVALNRGRSISRVFTFDKGIQEPLDSAQFELLGIRIPVESMAFWIRGLIVLVDDEGCLELLDKTSFKS